MKNNTFASFLSDFMLVYLPGKRQLSSNTIASYRDTFKLLLRYAETKQIKCENFQIENLTDDFVYGWLSWLENERGCTESSKRQRLSAIHSFVAFLTTRAPEHLVQYQQILEIKIKRAPQRVVEHLSPQEIKLLLRMPNPRDRFGKRDMVLLTVMYDGLLRVHEVCNLKVGDFRLETPGLITILGKGNKRRFIPIRNETLNLVRKYIATEIGKDLISDELMFKNHRGEKLTRIGVTYILKKYCDLARKEMPGFNPHVHPHMLRHSKAMHLRQSGASLIDIRDALGHSHVKTTEIYAKSDPESTRKMILDNSLKLNPDLKDWRENASLMDFLMGLSK